MLRELIQLEVALFNRVREMYCFLEGKMAREDDLWGQEF